MHNTVITNNLSFLLIKVQKPRNYYIEPHVFPIYDPHSRRETCEGESVELHRKSCEGKLQFLLENMNFE